MEGTTNHENQQGFSESMSTAGEAMKNHYEIEYSRFFTCPKTLSRTSAVLRPLPKSRKLRHGVGTWLSSSTASLRLLTDLTCQSLPQVVLVISLRERIHIQKFAMRFSNSYESQTFINSLQECLKDVRNIEIPCCNLTSDVSSQTEIITSNGVQDRADQELGLVNSTGNCSQLMQSSLNYQAEHYAFPKQTTIPNEFGGTCADLPSSFTNLLGGTCTALPPSSTNLLGGTCSGLPQSFANLLAYCCTEAEQEPPKVSDEVDLKSQIARCMTTTSFHDMLSTLEKVITDMGGDLAL